MSERDRQNPYDRNRQFGSARNSGAQGSGQAHQWQSGDYGQPGGDWQQDGGQRGGSDDYSGNYRFSGQAGSYEAESGQNRDYGRDDRPSYGQGYGQGSSGGAYRSQLDDDSLRSDQRDASRNYQQARGGYGQHNDRGQQDWQRGSGQRGNTSSYAPRQYDASGGNDFGSFTSEDYGGRDFSNRSGGAMGGMRSSESYRPSYGLSAWLHGDDDRDGRVGRNEYSRDRAGRERGREDYGSWRQYGESRGFLERAGDEVASWFGDEDATRRRERDRQAQGNGPERGPGQSHRGRGPSNYTRSDERIREDANDHLTHDHHVDASHITVSVKDGELALDGKVESRDAKRRAEDCVEHISGVKHVQNNLRVQERGSSSSSSYGSGYGNTGSTYAQASEANTRGQGVTGTSGTSATSGVGSSGADSTTGSTTGLGSSTTGTTTSTGASTSAGSTTKTS